MSKSDDALAKALLWAEARRQFSQPVDPTVGRCPTCGVYRNRSEVYQVERWECCVYACAVCGATIDEADTDSPSAQPPNCMGGSGTFGTPTP